MKKTLLQSFKLLLPLGIALLVTILVLAHFDLVDDFAKGFVEGFSAVFIVAGLSVIIGTRLGKKCADKK